MSQIFWDKNAEAWSHAVQSKLIASRKFTSPAVVQAVLDRKPKRVIDLGCGEGWIASELALHGIAYLGLDFSKDLIEAARRAHPQGSFELMSYEKLIARTWKPGFLADSVVFNFSLFEEDLRPILRAAAALTHPMGSIIIQTLHPAALSPYEDGWRIEDFKTFPTPFEGTMRWYGRTRESWMRTLTQSGLKIMDILEPVDPATKAPLSILFVTTPES
jgi:2-polyprenyl-3-methyl-5-hydroxy-6-metoxy-1,4-benzoquinol methylase